MKLRPAQEDILKYRGGKLAVSAVPGSGKTLTLTLLACELLAEGLIDVDEGQQILIVTFLNSTVDTFRARIRRRMLELEMLPAGFDVRTLHSLAMEILVYASGYSHEELPIVADEVQATEILERSVDFWIAENSDLWIRFLDEDNPRNRARWRDITYNTARSFIRYAKNKRYRPEFIVAQLQRQLTSEQTVFGHLGNQARHQQGEVEGSHRILKEPEGNYSLLWIMAGIYTAYQRILSRHGMFDFDDIVWKAVDTLEANPGLSPLLGMRWPYILEDEAQDSVPLQEILLRLLTAENGNWVRVGDSNQAITSSFTAAHPRYFKTFLEGDDVVSLPLPNSGRSAPLIFGAANRLVDWVCDSHPVNEVRTVTFLRQHIFPTPPGDGQPNPPDSQATIDIRVFKEREEDELPSVAWRAAEYAKEHPKQTIAILTPTNETGNLLIDHLDRTGAKYDDILRGAGRIREIAQALSSVLALLAHPTDSRRLASAYNALITLDHPDVISSAGNEAKISSLFLSAPFPERLLFGKDPIELKSSLPRGVVDDQDLAPIVAFSNFIGQVFELRSLPIDDLIFSIAELLFTDDQKPEMLAQTNLALAYQLANMVREWQDAEPSIRLPQLASRLAEIAEGRRRVNLTRNISGFEPEPGRITVATQHGAKGMEWDVVYLVGIDGFWLPNSLEAQFVGVHDFLGGDPAAEVVALLGRLVDGESTSFPNRSATESSNIELISERLRLFYVGITRARRKLFISRSTYLRPYRSPIKTEPASALEVIYKYGIGK